MHTQSTKPKSRQAQVPRIIRANGNNSETVLVIRGTHTHKVEGKKATDLLLYGDENQKRGKRGRPKSLISFLLQSALVT